MLSCRALQVLVIGVALLSVSAFLIARTVNAQGGTTYYVDCDGGNDANVGTADVLAWRSVSKANNANLQPGDRLLFKRGCAWQGPLKANWVGTAEMPITIGAYGTGELPRIQDSYSGNVQIGGSYLIVEYIETTLTVPPNPDANCNNQPVAWKVGFSFGPNAAYNTLQNSRASKMAVGVYLDYSSHHNRVLNNVLTDNHVLWTLNSNRSLGAMGVLLHGDYQEIAHNTFADNMAICTYNDVVESTSIELHGARFANIHHNSSYNDRVFSELGSSATYPSSDNTYAYNLHGVGQHQSAIGSRFIVTRGEGHSNGPVWRTTLYNNTVYHTGQDSKGVACQFCNAEVLVVKNNIFWVDREPISSDGPFVEENNLFWSTSGNPLLNFTQSLTSAVADPQFVAPAENDFHLSSTSPAVDSGSDDAVTAGYVYDLDQVPVPQDAGVDRGAYEWAGGPGEPTPTPTPVPVPNTIAVCTITINDGALYTGERTVQVKANMSTAAEVLVGNDAGFAGVSWQPYQEQFSWTLRDTGDRIATLLIYVRFRDAGGNLLCGGAQASDDIIYDPLPPTVTITLAEIAAAGPGAARAAAFAVDAKDQVNGSGVTGIQVSLDAEFDSATWQPPTDTVWLDVKAGDTVYVRAQDGSGNISTPASLTISQELASKLPSDGATSGNRVYLPMVEN